MRLPRLSDLPPVARRFVLYGGGFSVAVGIGFAPFLGNVKVKGYHSMLELFPWQLQHVLIPLSAFLMGLVAVGVQFEAGERVAASRIRRRFRAGLGAMCLGFFLFTILYFEFVRLPSFGGTTVAVIVADSRNPGCRCPPGTGDEACIQSLSLAPEAIESCWDGPSLRRREIELGVTYLLLTGGFASLIGLLVLRLGQQDRRRSGRAGRGSRSPTPPPAASALH
ncbi:MAG TPA: hypothetical protein VMW75_05680 [Thermoanaerobaculia bacterium]|nr:hypothetical protein [Thermoanaerobaculia bacterium]